MFKWPWLYCSITSRTSYGFRACWNFLLATKYLIFLIALMAFRCASVSLKIITILFSVNLLTLVTNKFSNIHIRHYIMIHHSQLIFLRFRLHKSILYIRLCLLYESFTISYWNKICSSVRIIIYKNWKSKKIELDSVQKRKK